MSKTGMFLGTWGQKLDNSLKQNLKTAIKLSIENYGISNFYFGNQRQTIWEEENTFMQDFAKSYAEILEYIAEEIQNYKKENECKVVKTALLLANPQDKNFKNELYDDILHAYPPYCDVTEDDEVEIYEYRDRFLIDHVEKIIWFSDPLFCKRGLPLDKVMLLDDILLEVEL